MTIQKFNDGEGLGSIRGKINAAIEQVNKNTSKLKKVGTDYVKTSGDQHIKGSKTFDDHIDLANGASMRTDFLDDDGVYRDTAEILKSTAGNQGQIELGSNKADLHIFAKTGIHLDKPFIGYTSVRGEVAAESLEVKEDGKAGLAINATELESAIIPVLENGVHHTAHGLRYNVTASKWVVGSASSAKVIVLKDELDALVARVAALENA